MDQLLLNVAVAQRHKLITIHEVCERTGMGTSFIHAEIAAGRFPKPVKLGASKSRRAAARFVDGEVSDWIEQRIAERDLPLFLSASIREGA
ncbi:AlpA family transcriptional regulator [Variovorax sp. YR266]|uniref:helix-turn-helix transcriptional regulator n=1 Tax=Variovorax sp. YR266 TaxID=1884386 RepID=UPI000A4D51F3|nr:AlpA family phage regulatory protein [Variovorax sp. YR266]